MGERREQYRSKDRRDGGKSRSRCRCGWCSGAKMRQQTMADQEADEAFRLWHDGEPMSLQEMRLRRSVPPALRKLPRYALADYLEEVGRVKDAEQLRSV